METPQGKRNTKAFGAGRHFRGSNPYRALTELFCGVLCHSAWLQPHQPTIQDVFCSLVPSLTLLSAACWGQRGLWVPSPAGGSPLWSSDVDWSKPWLSFFSLLRVMAPHHHFPSPWSCSGCSLLLDARPASSHACTLVCGDVLREGNAWSSPAHLEGSYCDYDGGAVTELEVQEWQPGLTAPQWSLQLPGLGTAIPTSMLLGQGAAWQPGEGLNGWACSCKGK